jgi:hypothetical protein
MLCKGNVNLLRKGKKMRGALARVPAFVPGLLGGGPGQSLFTKVGLRSQT